MPVNNYMLHVVYQLTMNCRHLSDSYNFNHPDTKVFKQKNMKISSHYDDCLLEEKITSQKKTNFGQIFNHTQTLSLLHVT